MGTPARLERTVAPHGAYVAVVPFVVKSLVVDAADGEQVVAFGTRGEALSILKTYLKAVERVWHRCQGTFGRVWWRIAIRIAMRIGRSLMLCFSKREHSEWNHINRNGLAKIHDEHLCCIRGGKEVATSNAARPDTELMEQYGCGPIKFTGADEALYERHLLFDSVTDIKVADARDRFEAIARSVRGVLSQRWIRTEQTYQRTNPKRVYYLSIEFLLGRSLANNVQNLLLDPIAKQLIREKNLDWLGVLEQEPDAGNFHRFETDPGRRQAWQHPQDPNIV